MNETRSPRFRSRLLLFGLMSFITALAPAAHSDDPSTAPAGGAPQGGRFIAAFELSPERNFRFSWPPESMRPAPYESVLMVVEKVPHVFDDRGRSGRSRPLLASRHLKTNGRMPKPLRLSAAQDSAGKGNEKETFLVRLEQGRLHLELTLPPGARLDWQYRTAKIKLYQASRD